MLLMLGLGLGLEVADFRRTLRAPRGLIVGLAGQLLLLPLLGIIAVQFVDLESAMTLGIILLTLCPGGALSNTICSLSNADVTLSVSLTAISSIVAPFSIPLIYGFIVPLLSIEQSVLDVPVGVMMGRLVAVSIFPIIVGMLVRRWLSLGRKVEMPVKILSVFLFLVLIVIIVITNFDSLRTGFYRIGMTLLMLNISAIATGIVVSKLGSLSRRQTITLSLEVGMQNAATATFISVTLLNNTEMALPAAVYATIMLPLAILVGLGGRYWIGQKT